MAKRSPIAGYNHNVRYRGLIFHVQTEDSGQQSPHLFTHLFYEGVIISTRKLVYDSGSAEEAIKGLMQSQHKLVLKDLKRGTFDDKIDLYLKDMPGLLPRGMNDDPPAGDVPRASEPALQRLKSEPEITMSRPETEHDLNGDLKRELEADYEPPPPPPAIARTATPPPIPRKATRPVAPPPPPSDDLDPPTISDVNHSISAAIHMANATVRTATVSDADLDEDAARQGRSRSGRDTDIEMPVDPRSPSYSDGVPGQIGASHSTRTRQDSGAPSGRITADRMTAVSASSLPPARPIARPPTRQPITPPAAVTRAPTEDPRARSESDAVEIYAPAPGSGDVGERPGQYAQHKRTSQRIPTDLLKTQTEQDRSAPIPSGLGRPRRTSQHAILPGSGGVPQRRDPAPSAPAHSQPVPRAQAPDLASRPAERPRTPTPARVSSSSAGSSGNRAPAASSGGVVMTRPAVIVGAPPKPATPPRVRKAREEEGRGFGQGLISEKSLDEVILAYLSEDADDK